MDSIERIEELIAQAHAKNTGFTATLESGRIIKACAGFIIGLASATVFDKNTDEEIEIFFTQIREAVLAENIARGPFDPSTVVPSGTESIAFC